jgi:hypothetical protein
MRHKLRISPPIRILLYFIGPWLLDRVLNHWDWRVGRHVVILLLMVLLLLLVKDIWLTMKHHARVVWGLPLERSLPIWVELTHLRVLVGHHLVLELLLLLLILHILLLLLLLLIVPLLHVLLQ